MSLVELSILLFLVLPLFLSVWQVAKGYGDRRGVLEDRRASEDQEDGDSSVKETAVFCQVMFYHASNYAILTQSSCEFVSA